MPSMSASGGLSGYSQRFGSRLKACCDGRITPATRSTRVIASDTSRFPGRTRFLGSPLVYPLQILESGDVRPHTDRAHREGDRDRTLKRPRQVSLQKNLIGRVWTVWHGITRTPWLTLGRRAKAGKKPAELICRRGRRGMSAPVSAYFRTFQCISLSRARCSRHLWADRAGLTLNTPGAS